jgi:MFS family permease
MKNESDGGEPRRRECEEPEEEMDSAATTLLASAESSKAGSFEKERVGGKRYADVELERWGGRDDGPKADAEEGGGDDDDDEDGNEGEEHRLLPDSHSPPSHTPTPAVAATAQTAQSVDPDQPQPPPLDPFDPKSKRESVSWSSLPQKSQLAILTLARLSEPLTQTSLQSYMFYQLKSFHGPDSPPPSDSTVAAQAGMLAAAFTGAQFVTAMLWGRLSDWEGLGRKRVILIGLIGTMVGSLGFGFSKSFGQAVFWRVIGGMLNGNVGVMRTMISEIVKEKKFQSRAFLLLPMTFNIGVIIGPLLGGVLADPVGSYPALFSQGGIPEHARVTEWLRWWPYALPNVVNAVFLGFSALGVVLGLEETLEGIRGRRKDWGRAVGKWIGRMICGGKTKGSEYTALSEEDVEMGEAEGDVQTRARKPEHSKGKRNTKRKLPFRRIWTPNLILTLIAHFLLASHVGTFNNLWFVFLSTPRYTPDSTNNDGDSKTLHLPPNYRPHLPFTFTGGLALPPPSIGTALAILGVIGISLQLLLYPRLSQRWGTQASFRLALCLFPLAHVLAPYLAIIPSATKAPAPASGFLVWAYITLLLCIQVTARTFALPSTAILVNNACPHPSVLGTVHGLAQSVSSAARTLGPVVAGWAYGSGLSNGVVGAAWWGMAGVAVVGAFAGQWVREGSGHELHLEGEEEINGKG